MKFAKTNSQSPHPPRREPRHRLSTRPPAAVFSQAAAPRSHDASIRHLLGFLAALSVIDAVADALEKIEADRQALLRENARLEAELAMMKKQEAKNKKVEQDAGEQDVFLDLF